MPGLMVKKYGEEVGEFEIGYSSYGKESTQIIQATKVCTDQSFLSRRLVSFLFILFSYDGFN